MLPGIQFLTVYEENYIKRQFKLVIFIYRKKLISYHQLGTSLMENQKNIIFKSQIIGHSRGMDNKYINLHNGKILSALNQVLTNLFLIPLQKTSYE